MKMDKIQFQGFKMADYEPIMDVQETISTSYKQSMRHQWSQLSFHHQSLKYQLIHDQL